MCDEMIDLLKMGGNAGAGCIYLPYEAVGRFVARALEVRNEFQRLEEEIARLSENLPRAEGGHGA